MSHFLIFFSQVKKEEKSSKSESDLKKRLLEKQKAKKSKSSAPPNTKGIDSLFRLSAPAVSISVFNSNLWSFRKRLLRGNFAA